MLKRHLRRILKAGCLLSAAVICAGALAGCGEAYAEQKIGKEARYYIANKYKFRPGTTGVELRHVGDMEGVWHKQDGGTASMEYQGHHFRVYVSLTDPSATCDDYLRPEVDEYLSDYFGKVLECDSVHAWAVYGTPVCMVPGDVKSVEDVFSKCDNIEVYVSTTGLDRESAKTADLSGLGADTHVSIIDWTSEDCVKDEDLMRETTVGLETDSYTDGFEKVRSYYRYYKGDVRALEK